jgi:hypothetical protein
MKSQVKQCGAAALAALVLKIGEVLHTNAPQGDAWRPASGLIALDGPE